MRTYFDTSALIKLVVTEAETSALRHYLREIGGDTLFTAALTRTELIRAVRRVDVHALAAARRVLAGRPLSISPRRSSMKPPPGLRMPIAAPV